MKLKEFLNELKEQAKKDPEFLEQDVIFTTTELLEDYTGVYKVTEYVVNEVNLLHAKWGESDEDPVFRKVEIKLKKKPLTGNTAVL